VNYLYIVRQDYQDSLLTTVRHRERSGTLRILGEERLYYAPTIRHDPTLICWEPRSTTQDAGRSSPSLEA
jgi:hypothetical protein